jgi:Tfp pilus assembly protein PilO
MNKDLLKISERDKKLLMILSMILAAFLCYYFVLNPAMEKGSVLQSQYAAATLENQRVKTVIGNLPALKKEEIKEKNLLSEKYKQFFYEISEDRILYKLNTTMAEAGFPVDVVSFTRASAAEISVETPDYQPLVYPLYINASKTNPSLEVPKPQNKDEANQGQPQNQDALPNDAAAYTDMTIGFTTSSYESIFGFLKKMETLDRSIIVKKIEIENSLQNTGLQGQIVLGIYSIAKPDRSESVDFKFNPILPKGKANPFL